MSWSWDAVGAIGEILGAIAVVVSVAYLALQIRQNTRSVHGATSQGVVDSAQALLRIGAQDKTAARVFRLGALDPAQLDPDERAQYFVFVTAMFRGFENHYYQAEAGNLERRMRSSYVKALRVQLGFAGVRQWWPGARGMFGPEFVAFVEEAIAAHRGSSSNGISLGSGATE